MSKKLQYPNGYVGVVSDAVAVILAKRKGHTVLGDAKEPEKMRNVTPEKPKSDAK